MSDFIIGTSPSFDDVNGDFALQVRVNMLNRSLIEEIHAIVEFLSNQRVFLPQCKVAHVSFFLSPFMALQPEVPFIEFHRADSPEEMSEATLAMDIDLSKVLIHVSTSEFWMTAPIEGTEGDRFLTTERVSI